MCIIPTMAQLWIPLELGRSLWTVNWHALQNQPDILLRNERQIDILETKNFGVSRLLKWARCRSAASSRFTRGRALFSAGTRNRFSNSAAQRLCCSANLENGAR